MTNTVLSIIEKLGLEPHPEGGYFKETYRSSGIIQSESLDTAYKGYRNYSTCIYFLMTGDNFSAFHRIKQDEIWHFYNGSPIRLHVIEPKGTYYNVLIGKDIDRGQLPQYVVPGGSWFGAEVELKDSFSLLGCTVSPGFSFEDFELIQREELLALFPQHKEIITHLTRS